MDAVLSFLVLLAGLSAASAGDQQIAVPRDPTAVDAAPYGYHLLVPTTQDPEAVFPLLVFLHGSGERGDSAEQPEVLGKVLYNGPPLHIDRGEWSPPEPMIVLSPQSHTVNWEPADVRALIEWADRTLPVDRTRIYLTGLSRGGTGVWNYLAVYGRGEGDSLAVAAAAPICGRASAGPAATIAGTPVWAFHGTADDVVPPGDSVAMVKKVGRADPVEAPRLTLLSGVNHGSWVPVYAGTELGGGLRTFKADPEVERWLVAFEPGLWTWLLAHRR